jgi:hypothetical protein
MRFKKIKQVKVNKDGSEKPHGKPNKIHIDAKPVSMRQKMRNLWAEFRQKELEAGQYESNADAADFEVDNDEFPRSPYEHEEALSDAIENAPEELKASEGDQQKSPQQAEGVQDEN